ncbi:unnamed protein product [Blepharisma stoltei]|uniref:Anaphase-promoting complex subunit 4-like WD40 domain-containing protein n=1 Tax=Blepharisma stoltei TaxID=1481888 RepID=A0AAU9ITG0_9CILI|nr:unnamed protein product [Blepharisma stoltei]
MDYHICAEPECQNPPLVCCSCNNQPFQICRDHISDHIIKYGALTHHYESIGLQKNEAYKLQKISKDLNAYSQAIKSLKITLDQKFNSLKGKIDEILTRLDNAIHYIKTIKNNIDKENQNVKKFAKKHMNLISEEIANLEADINTIEDIKISASKIPSLLEEEEKGPEDKTRLKIDEFSASSIFQLFDSLDENNLYELEQDNFNKINICNRDDILNNFETLTEKQSNLLCNIIFSTRVNKNLALAASNAMSILVKSKFSFDNKDFTNVKIPYANLSGGIFFNTDFSGSDSSISTDCLNVISKGTKIPNLERNGLRNLSISHNEEYIAATHNKKIYIWDLNTKEKINEITEDSAYLIFTKVSWSYDDIYLVTGDYEGTVFIWESITGNLFAKIKHDKGLIPCILWTPDDDYKIALCCYQHIAVINLVGEIVFKQHLGCNTTIIAWSQSGTYIACYSGNNWINIWNIKDSKEYKHKIKNIYALEWIYKDDYLAFAGKDCYIYIWNFISDVMTWRLANNKLEHPIKVLEWNKKLKLLAVGCFNGFINLWGLFRDKNTIYQKCEITFRGHSRDITALSWASHFLVSAGLDGTISIRNIKIDFDIEKLTENLCWATQIFN